MEKEWKGIRSGVLYNDGHVMVIGPNVEGSLAVINFDEKDRGLTWVCGEAAARLLRKWEEWVGNPNWIFDVLEEVKGVEE